MNTVKARITASKIHPNTVSIRDREGHDIRRALDCAGFEVGELVTIQTDEDVLARDITEHAWIVYGYKGSSPTQEDRFIPEMRTLLKHLIESLSLTDDRRGVFDLEVRVRVKSPAQSTKGESK